MRAKMLNESVGNKVYLLYASDKDNHRRYAELVGVFSSFKNVVKEVKDRVDSNDMWVDEEKYPKAYDNENNLLKALKFGFFDKIELDKSLFD